MKASELILALQERIQTHGDQKVRIYYLYEDSYVPSESLEVGAERRGDDVYITIDCLDLKDPDYREEVPLDLDF